MADLSDVEDALVAQVAAALGLGTYAPPALATSAQGVSLRAYRGWPNADALDADILAGAANVSVLSDPGGRNTTRYQDAWQVAAVVTPTLTASVAGLTVTFGGTGGAGMVAGLLVGNGMIPVAYAYRLTASDTAASVAAAFAAKVVGASAIGPVLTLASGPVSANIVADQSAWQETRRQEHVARVTTWAPSPGVRDAVAGAIDGALARVHWLPLPDGASGRLIYSGSVSLDQPSKASIWRRDLRYRIDFPTTYIQQQPECLFVGNNYALGIGGASLHVGPFPPS